MSLPATTHGYGLRPDDGEAIWMRGGAQLVFKATTDQTEGRYTVVEVRGPKGWGPPLHTHSHEDEFFVVLEGEVRIQIGDEVCEAVPGSTAYGPRNVGHTFQVDSPHARFLMFFGPGGVERFFRSTGKPGQVGGPSPSDEEFLPIEQLMEIAGRHGQTFIGPPLPPKE